MSSSRRRAEGAQRPAGLGVLPDGEVIGNYRIERVLGRGGMAVVYEATQLSLDRAVALKVLAPKLAHDENFRERLRREARRQAALEHPNIVAVHDLGEDSGHLFLVMRLIRGRTLADVIADDTLSARQAVALLEPVADALDHAHLAGFVHRDVKPENILIDERGHPYLADFGLVRAADDAGLTQQGYFLGTVAYVAPEQMRSEPPTPAGDVYSFAAVAFETLTGEAPYERDSELDTMHAHFTDPVPDASALTPDLPSEVGQVLMRGLAKDPAQRPPSATGLVRELAAWLD